MPLAAADPGFRLHPIRWCFGCCTPTKAPASWRWNCVQTLVYVYISRSISARDFELMEGQMRGGADDRSVNRILEKTLIALPFWVLCTLCFASRLCRDNSPSSTLNALGRQRTICEKNWHCHDGVRCSLIVPACHCSEDPVFEAEDASQRNCCRILHHESGDCGNRRAATKHVFYVARAQVSAKGRVHWIVSE
jgi:hypothetical protein